MDRSKGWYSGSGKKWCDQDNILESQTPDSHLIEAKQNLSANFTISRDLIQIGIGTPKSS